MTLRFNPKIYLLTGLLFWSLFSLFHLILFFLEEELNNSIYRAIYLIFLGSFLFSFYRYYDLVFPKVSRKEIFNSLTERGIYIFNPTNSHEQIKTYVDLPTSWREGNCIAVAKSEIYDELFN